MPKIHISTIHFAAINLHNLYFKSGKDMLSGQEGCPDKKRLVNKYEQTYTYTHINHLNCVCFTRKFWFDVTFQMHYERECVTDIPPPPIESKTVFIFIRDLEFENSDRLLVKSNVHYQQR